VADRYWGGGTGGWNTTNTANWYSDLARTTLAGAVPTAADDVFFDNLSNATLYTCTLTTTPVCRSLSISGPATGNVTIAGSVALAISGNLTIASTGVTRTYTGAITFNATTTGWTVSAGVSLASAINFSGVGGGWTLTAGLTTTGGLTFTTGTFDTGSNFNIGSGNFTLMGTGVRTVNLNASFITCGGVQITTLTNLTFNAGTSTITTSALSFSAFNPSTPITFYNYAFSSTSFATITLQNLTFNNLTFPAKAAIGLTPIVLATNITVNGLLTCTAPTTLGSSRYFIKSDTYGTTRTLTAATVALTDVDFQDITTGGSWTGTRLGDAGGNSGITFTTGVPKYWNLVTGGASTGLGWALGSGGTPSAANFPLPQDTMTFVDTGLNTSATVTLGSAYNFGGIDCSARTLAMTLATVTTSLYGSIALSTAVTMSGTAVLTFQNRGAITITSAGRTFTQAITFNGIGGSYTLNGAWTTSGTVILTYGTLSLVTYTFTVYGFASTAATVRSINFGASGSFISTVAASFASPWNTNVATNLTITGTNPLMVVSNPTANPLSIATGSVVGVSNLLNFNIINGAYALVITGYVNNLDFTGYAGACSFSSGNIYGDLILSTGMTATSMSPIFLGTANQTITSNGKTLGAITVTKTGAGVLSLVDNLAVAAAFTTTSGNFDAANQNISATVLTSTGTVARSLTMGSGTWTLTSTGTVWGLATATGMTLNANTSTILFSNTTTTARTFAGGGLTYNNLVIGGATGISTLTFTGSNTFTGTISSAKTVAHTLSFTAGTTTTVADWTVTGTVGNVVTIGSATAASHNLVKTGGGNISINYMSISRSNASPGATWYAGANSTDGGNNTGWLFTIPPIPGTSTGNFFFIF
jgi:hypothetical protein